MDRKSNLFTRLINKQMISRDIDYLLELEIVGQAVGRSIGGAKSNQIRRSNRRQGDSVNYRHTMSCCISEDASQMMISKNSGRWVSGCRTTRNSWRKAGRAILNQDLAAPKVWVREAKKKNRQAPEKSGLLWLWIALELRDVSIGPKLGWLWNTLGLRENSSQLGGQFLRYWKNDLETSVSTPFWKLKRKEVERTRTKPEGACKIRANAS